MIDGEERVAGFDDRLALDADLEGPQPRRVEAPKALDLRSILRGRKHLGDSPREELMYEAIDKLLAKKRRGKAPRNMEDLKPAVVNDIRALWKKHLL